MNIENFFEMRELIMKMPLFACTGNASGVSGRRCRRLCRVIKEGVASWVVSGIGYGNKQKDRNTNSQLSGKTCDGC